MEKQSKEKKVDIKVHIKRNAVMEATDKAGLLSETEKTRMKCLTKMRMSWTTS